MPLTQEEKNQISLRLKNLDALRPCEACGNNQFALADEAAQVRLSPNPGTYSTLTIPSVGVVCRRCGCIRLHSLGVLGLMELGTKNA
jgi:hypothetical protein